MSNIKNLEKIGAIGILVAVILFNIYLHKAELTIRSEPNDNIFQFALIDEAKNILTEIGQGKLSIFYLFDSFNGRWNEGFALSTYYAHLPQAAIAFFSLVSGIDAFTIFRLLKFLMLVLLPLPFFLSARILKLSYWYAGLVALFSQLIFTNGLYGIDSSSFLWRGWGLSSQLFAVFFLPLAFSYTFSYITDGRNLGKAVLFNFLMAQCHLGIFYMSAISYPLMGVIGGFGDLGKVGGIGEIREIGKRLIKLGFWIGFSVSYYLIPFFLQGEYRNYSFWDPGWKFDSFGLNQALIWFFNGELFDYGRVAIITLLASLGFFWGFYQKNKIYRIFSVLFVIYFAFFAGRGFIGALINLFPGLSEFHLHRFIVMFQFVGIYLGAGLVEKVVGGLRETRGIREIGMILIIGAFLFFEKPNINYAKDNALWIERANKSYEKDIADYQKITARLKKEQPGRVYAGRPGNWGREFKLGDTQLYMALSVDGFNTIGFSPESWSPNAEFDQYFNDGNVDYYNLYNVTHAIFPENITPPKFARPIQTSGKYRLYEIDTDGWYAIGTSRLRVESNKYNLVNITRLWQTGELLKEREYPRIILGSKGSQGDRGDKGDIMMISLSEWEDMAGKRSSLWEKNPFIPLDNKISYLTGFDKQKEDVMVQGYRVKFKMNKDCPNCILVLKNTYHPNWQVSVNGKPEKVFPVFPYYIGVPINTAGEYMIEAVYKPNGLKIFLIVVEVVVLGGWIVGRYGRLGKSGR